MNQNIGAYLQLIGCTIASDGSNEQANCPLTMLLAAGQFRGWEGVLKAPISALFALVLVFLLGGRCTFFLSPSRFFLQVSLAFAVIFGLVVLTNIGRAVLVIVIFAGWCAFGNVCFQHFAGYESGAVWQMRRARQELAKAAYPDHEQRISWVDEKFYEIRYVPEPEPPFKQTTHYALKAHPTWYGCCGAHSFLLTEEGVLHYTAEDRDATLHDPVLE